MLTSFPDGSTGAPNPLDLINDPVLAADYIRQQEEANLASDLGMMGGGGGMMMMNAAYPGNVYS